MGDLAINKQVVCSNPGRRVAECNPGQKHVPLSPSSIIWCRPTGGDARRAWRKVVAAYRRVYGFGHLWADCRGPGSAPEPYARFEYAWDYLTFTCKLNDRNVRLIQQTTANLTRMAISRTHTSFTVADVAKY